MSETASNAEPRTQAGRSTPEFAPLPLLWVWHDSALRAHPENMAVDELLLRSGAEHPILRVYRWAGPAISFGYAEKSAPVAARFPGLPLVRRWTGGGVVEHGSDQTYTLVLPRAAAPAWQNSVAVYAWVHAQLATALRECGIPAICVGDGAQVPGSLCFAAPVRHDVIVGGNKVAGAGQRRTQEGLLHQGSVQGEAVIPGLMDVMARLLADEGQPCPPHVMPLPGEVADLTHARYADPAWTLKM